MCYGSPPTVQKWGGVRVPPAYISGTLPGSALCTRVQAGGVCHGRNVVKPRILPEYYGSIVLISYHAVVMDSCMISCISV